MSGVQYRVMSSRARDRGRERERDHAKSRRYPKSQISLPSIIVANGRAGSTHSSPRNSPRDSPRNSPRDSPRNSPSLRSVITTPLAIAKNILTEFDEKNEGSRGTKRKSYDSHRRSRKKDEKNSSRQTSSHKPNRSSKNDLLRSTKNDLLRSSKTDLLREIKIQREVNLDTPSSSRSPLATIATVSECSYRDQFQKF